ncbi:MAG: FtsX-like permease family protein [Bacteroidales bacterium]|nr:FtsX-like permease family protein [Bacteroidales bacterium]
MRYETFIASRFLPRGRTRFAGNLAGIASASIALGVIVMLMAVCILRGFQGAIADKVAGFGSHIVVRSYATGSALDAYPVSTQRPEVERIRNVSGVRHLQFFANKGGMVKTNDQIHGIIFKGVDSGFDTTFFASCLTKGRLFRLADSTATNEVIISQVMARKLHFSIGDKVRTYFWQGNTYRARAFVVAGIYNTDLTEFDEHYIIGDLRQVQRLNGWQSDQVGGYEVLLKNYNNIDIVAPRVLECLSLDLTQQTISEANPALFSWLDLLNSNIVLIIVLMALVCSVAIVSSLLIMIFEKTSTIGILKTLGATNAGIRRIFLTKATSIVLRGLVAGNIVALALCVIQKTLNIVTLDSEIYSMSAVPIDINPFTFIIISIGTLAICLVALLLPTSYISRIEPAQSIRVEN